MSAPKYYYVYRLSSLREHKHYYGSRGCSVLPSSEDLGKAYFTSSTTVSILFRSNPAEFKTKIIRLFETREAAFEFENKILTRTNAVDSERFYNKSRVGATKPQDEALRRLRISKHHRWKQKSCHKLSSTA